MLGSHQKALWLNVNSLYTIPRYTGIVVFCRCDGASLIDYWSKQLKLNVLIMLNSIVNFQKFQICADIPFDRSPEVLISTKLCRLSPKTSFWYKIGHISANFASRGMKLLFLERKFNFASYATIFSGLLFLNFSQNVRDFYCFAYVARDFFADSALFCLEFFRGTNFCKIKYCDWKFGLFRFHWCIISLAR